MEGKNLNEIFKTDPSFQGGYLKVYERNANVDMKIVERNIIDMVGKEPSSIEKVHFKILVRGKTRPSNRDNIFDEKPQPFLSPKSKEDPEQNPEVIRIELMSDNDPFFQYVHE